MEARKVTAKVTPGLDEQFVTGRLYGKQINMTSVCGIKLLTKQLFSIVYPRQ